MRKIKEIYDCEYIVSEEELYPLQKWHNQLIDKTMNEITVSDVLRMIRQQEFMDLAILKAVKFLQESVFIGEAYDGELFEKLAEIDTSSLIPYKENLKDILKHALEESVIHEWSYDGEREEFEEIVDLWMNLYRKVVVEEAK